MRHFVIRTSLAAALAALLPGLLTGCFTVESGVSRVSGATHLLVSNYGWYLFDTIPLVCGNAKPDRLTPFVLFRDDVTMDKVQQRFMNSAAAQGTSADDLVYRGFDSVMLSLPGVDIPLPLPYLLTYRELQLSGHLRRDRQDVAKGGGE